MDILGNDLHHFFLGVLILLDNLFEQLMQTSDGLIILLDGVGHDEYIST